MKKIISIFSLFTLIFVLVACGGTETTTGANVSASSDTVLPGTLTEDFEDALTIKNQLLLGTIRLENTDMAIDAAQSAQLIPLWTAMESLTTSGTAADEEITALQNQIMVLMTGSQIQSIAEMQLTNEDSRNYYIEIGVTTPSTPSPDVTGTPQSMGSLSKEDREATKVAQGTPVGSTSGSGKGNILIEKVIELLKDKSA